MHRNIAALIGATLVVLSLLCLPAPLAQALDQASTNTDDAPELANPTSPSGDSVVEAGAIAVAGLAFVTASQGARKTRHDK